MSAQTPDFYIGISTQNPPKIISIGRTIDGMEEVEVRLDQPDEDKLNIFKGKIDDIQTGEDFFKLADTIDEELKNYPIEVVPPAPSAESSIETPIDTAASAESSIETPIDTAASAASAAPSVSAASAAPSVSAESSIEAAPSTESLIETPIDTSPSTESLIETPIDTSPSAESSIETPIDTAVSASPVAPSVPAPANSSTRRGNRSTGPGNTFRNMAGLNALGNVASSLFGNGGAGKNTKKHKITKRYKNKLIKRRKTKRSKSNRIK